MLIEIVGNRTNGPNRPRGIVLCDPGAPNGWALVVFVADAGREIPEVRFFPAAGLEQVTTAPEAFALQLTTPEQAEEKYADLLAVARTLLPQAVQGLSDLHAHPSLGLDLADPEEEFATSPFELPADEPAPALEAVQAIDAVEAVEPVEVAQADVAAGTEPEARLRAMMLEGATMAMNGLARMRSLWKSMVQDIAISPRAVSWATGPVPAPKPSKPKTPPRGRVTVELISPGKPSDTRPLRIVRRRRPSS